MSNLRAFFAHEFKRLLCTKKLFVLALMVILLFYAVFEGINDYKNTLDIGTEFQNIEAVMFKKLTNYAMYKATGVRFLFIPSSAMIFFTNSGLFSDLSARINPITDLAIYNNCKGTWLLQGHSSISLDFSGIILLLATLFSLFIGYESLHHREYLKMLSCTCSYKRIFFSIILVRLIYLTLLFILIYGIMVVVPICHKIPLSNADFAGLLGHGAAALVMLFFFFFAGLLIGILCRSNWTGIAYSLAVWITFVFIITGPINSLIAKNAAHITSVYRTELEKMKVASDFEKRAENKNGKFDRNKINEARKVIEDYWNNDYKKIAALEKKFKNEIAAVIERYSNRSVITPTSFYNLTANEVSSRGYGNFLDFYTYLQKRQRKFVRFFIDRTYYNDPNELVSFITSDENLFKGKSRLPANFAKGLIINLLYIIILSIASYLQYRKTLFPMPEKEKAFNNIPIELEKEKLFTFNVYHPDFIDQFLNVFFGQFRGEKWKVTIDGKDVVNWEKKEFLYLPNPRNIPGEIKAGDFLSLFNRLLKLPKKETREIKAALGKSIINKRFSHLDPVGKIKLMLALAELKKSRSYIYIFNDFIFGIPGYLRKSLSDRVEVLKRNGALVIDIVSNDCFWLEPDSMSTVALRDSEYKELRDPAAWD